MPAFSLTYRTWPEPARWTTAVIIIVVVIVGHRLGAPGWTVPAGLGGCLLSLGPGTARAVQLRLGTAQAAQQRGKK
jgi:hypothetical protein